MLVCAGGGARGLAAGAGAPPPTPPTAATTPATAPPGVAASLDDLAGGGSGAGDLDPKYRAWLEEVAPLINERERKVFLALNRDYQRDEFIQKFWDVRDPYPETPQNELRDEWEERIKAARDRYGNVTEDRARVLLIHGEPAHVFHSRCSDVVLPLEIWSYEKMKRSRREYAVVFVQDMGAVRGRYRLWAPGEGLLPLLAMQARSRYVEHADDSAALASCLEGSDIAGYLTEAIDEKQLEEKGHVLPRPSDEWLSSFAAASTDLPAGATPLPADLDISFPGRAGSRTVMQGLVHVPRQATAPEQVGDRSFFAFVVDGEVLRNDQLFEHFRYRFSFPVEAPAAAPAAKAAASAAPAAGSATSATSAAPAATSAEGVPGTGGSEIPLVFQRYFRPGTYTLLLKVEDIGGKRFYRAERDLNVPAVAAPVQTAALPGAPGTAATPTTPAAAPAAGGGAGATTASTAAGPGSAPGAQLAEANAAIRAGDQTVRLLPPQDGLLTGAVRIEAIADGGGIDHVRFQLDGKPALTKRHSPYSVDLNLGSQPRAHVVKAFAEGADGKVLAEDQLVLNAGPHRFSVRLIEPQAGKMYRASLRAEAQVEVPEGEKLDRLELYRNDALVATLYQPPWTQPILLPASSQVSYVRAVAYLADGNSCEDLVLVNSPNPGERIDVQMVELYTTVTDRRGRPVDGLQRDDFKVYEDGAEQSVRRFERVQDLPIYAGVLLDTSGSMLDHLDTAVQAALSFFHTVITPKDRAAVITFNGEPNLAVRFTNNSEVLAGGLAGLRADGSTALYDSIIYTLYYFGGVRGKRAVVLLTDGKDEGSRFRYAEALEYAKHSGIAFYTIGLGLTAKEPDIRMKLVEIADQTGGRSFFIDRVVELSGAYRQIEAELRSQYLIAYQSTKQGSDGKFRNVEVKLDRSGMAARTVPGYYP